MEFANRERGKREHRWIDYGKNGRDFFNHGIVRNGERLDDGDGDGGDIEIAGGDAGESDDNQGRYAAIHGDRDFQR